MTRQRFNVTTLILVMMFTSAVLAGVPGLISYQGQLNDDTGAPVNGTVSFVFSIYDVPNGGSALWTENQTLPVSNGVFNVELGAATTLPASLFLNDDLYLGIQVGADSEMTPRQRLTSGTYAQEAELVSHSGLPIGTVMAWAKDLPGVPPLEGSWVECNGQVLADPQSPLDGQVIPDLNVAGRMLRGSSSSGTVESQDHTHEITTGYSGNGTVRDDTGDGVYLFGSTATVAGNPLALPVTQRWSFKVEDAPQRETFSVVWIMKVR